MEDQRWEFREWNCVVCGGRDTRVLGYHGGEAHRQKKGITTRIVKCRTCQLIFPNPMPFPEGEDIRYRDVSDYFDNLMNATDEDSRSLGKRVVQQAEHLLGRKGRLLDVGCGRGGIVWAAVQAGWEGEGCDISEPFVKFATEVTRINAHASTVEAMNYPDDTFDVVILSEVIEHLYDPTETIKELSRIIRPGGLLYVSTPNEDSIYQFLGNLYYRLRGIDWCVNLCPTWNLYHIYGFGPASLRYLLERHDFTIEEMVLYAGTTPLPKRDGLWGFIERAGTNLVGYLAKISGRNPYMYAWARRQS